MLRSKLTTRDGYNPTEHGAWIDWNRLATSALSSTEIGVVHIARGIAVLEHHDGPPPHLCEPVREAIAAVTQLPPGHPPSTTHPDTKTDTTWTG